jgi:hypothetical protein
MLQQLDYLSKEDQKAATSGQQPKMGKPVKIVEAAPAADAAAAPAH